MVTFKDIIERWRALPRNRRTGRPMRKSLALHEFKRWLTSAGERAWFKACHAWCQGQSGPDCQEAITEILASLDPFQRNMGQAHLECAWLSSCARTKSFLSEIESIARRRGLLEPFLLELVNEIRCGQPRLAISQPVCVAFPLVWKETKTAVLGRFKLETAAEGNPFSPAQGEVFPAPAQSLFLDMDEDFRSTFATVAAVVRDRFQVNGDKQVSLPDVRVSIELFEADPVPATISLEGKSGGVALAVGVAKCWSALEQFQPQHSVLSNLSLNTVAITAQLLEDGSLNGVGDIHIKVLLKREAEAHEVNVLVVAENQTGLPVNTNEPDSKSLLLPCGDWIPASFARKEELRSPQSLAVFRINRLFDVGPTLRRSQANTLLKVLEKPYVVGPYLVAGNNVFYLALLSFMVAGWYLLPGWWFLPVTFLLLAAGIFVVRYRIQKIKRGAGFYLLPQTANFSPGNWSQMVATLKLDHSRFTCISWFKSLLEQASQERLTLKGLPWIWLRDEWFWLRLAVPLVLLVLSCTPLQHCVAEQVYPGTAGILSGESRRGEGNNSKYASFDSNCESGMCLNEATIGSYGLIRLQVQPKPRTARFLRVKSTSPISYVKVDDNALQESEIVVPIVNDEARFYYGIDENYPWEIVLDLEVLCYCGQVLQKGRLVGYRASPGE
jgi:hypothetical protein